MLGDLITILSGNLINVLGIFVTVFGFITAFTGAAARIERTLRRRFKGDPSRLALLRFALRAVVNLITVVVVVAVSVWLARPYLSEILSNIQRIDVRSVSEIIVGSVVCLVLIVFIPLFASHRLARKPLWIIPVPLLRVIVQSGVTLLALALIGGGLYAGYWLGLFPRSSAGDAFVAAAGATAVKFLLTGAVLFGKGVIGGGGAYVGQAVVKGVTESRAGKGDVVSE
jgi:hypothetical protein